MATASISQANNLYNCEEIPAAQRPIIGRKEAKTAGLNQYFTGVPCVNGHVAERNAHNGTCMVCQRAGQRNHYDKYRRIAPYPIDPSVRDRVIPRKEAEAAGLVRYFTGVPCKRGHTAARTVSNNRCTACAFLAVKKYKRKYFDEDSPRGEKLRKYDIERRRRQKLQHRFGITVDQYEALLARQNGVCAICKEKEKAQQKGQPVRRLAVDHDHMTGAIRGLLCRKCNQRLGVFERHRRVFEAYLNGYPTRLLSSSPAAFMCSALSFSS